MVGPSGAAAGWFRRGNPARPRLVVLGVLLVSLSMLGLPAAFATRPSASLPSVAGWPATGAGSPEALRSIAQAGTAESERGTGAVAPITRDAPVPAGGVPVITEWDNISGVPVVQHEHPPPLVGAAMAYYPTAQMVLLFGGDSKGGPTAFTWAGYGFPGSPTPGFFWVNLTGAVGLAPSPRYFAAVTYDPTYDGILLFGGQFSGAPGDVLGDTWLFRMVGATPSWTLLSPGDHPSPRAGAGFAYDPADGYDVLFGGVDDPNYYNDTWTFSAGVWHELRPTPAPFVRAYGGFFWDTNLNVAILLPGDGGSVDVWGYVGGAWYPFSSTTPLGPRIAEASAFDTTTGNLTVFGGENYSLTSDFSDTWNFSKYSFWATDPTYGPSPRAGSAIAYDAFMGDTIMFGGADDHAAQLLNDTWIFGTWPVSVAPFSVKIVAHPAPALRPTVQPNGTARFTVIPTGGFSPYSYEVTLEGPTDAHPPPADVSGKAKGPFNVNFTFPLAASYYIFATVDLGLGRTGYANLTYPVGSVVLTNWQPVTDAYSFGNYGGFWSSQGNCFGFSSTTILYWEHDIEQLSGTPYLPAKVSDTAALKMQSPAILNGSTLSILVHQIGDPHNQILDGGGFGAGSMASNYATLMSNLAAGKPALMFLQAAAGYHAVVAYGEWTNPFNGNVHILTTNPNVPQATSVGHYNPTAETFWLQDSSANYSAWEISNHPQPDTLQPSWLGPAWGNSHWYPANSGGYFFVFSTEPVTVSSSRGGSDWFSDWSNGDSQSFVQQVPQSAGIEEPYTYVVNGSPVPGSVQVFAFENQSGYDYTVTDPSPSAAPIQILLSGNSSGTPKVRGMDLSFSSAGTHYVNLTPSPNGTTVRVGGKAVGLNATFGQLIGSAWDGLNATDLPLPAFSIASFTVHNWSALPSPSRPSVTVRLATDNGSGPVTQYQLSNGQVGLGPGVPLDYGVTFHETGLPAGKSWTVTVNGSTQSLGASSATFELKNGSYPYVIAGPAGHPVTGAPASGTVSVGGSAQSVSFSFTKGPTRTVTFVQKGLPSAQLWCVALQSWESCSTGRSLAYRNLTSGSYGYDVLSPTSGQTIIVKLGKATLAPSGTLSVGRSLRVTVTFAYPYPVTFQESGLASGSWSVTIHHRTVTEPAGTSIAFALTNGTYPYRVGHVAGWRSSGLPSKLLVRGAAAQVNVTFAIRAQSIASAGLPISAPPSVPAASLGQRSAFASGPGRPGGRGGFGPRRERRGWKRLQRLEQRRPAAGRPPRSPPQAPSGPGASARRGRGPPRRG